ncbi:Mrpl35 [Columba livia]|nr:Mrpl35 [Columba livia]
MAAAAARGAVAGILGRWAPWAARSPAAGRALSGLAARAVGQVRAPAAAPLWKPRLLPGNPPRGGGTSILSSVTSLLPNLLQQPARTLTYCSLRKGKRKTVKAVTKRFLRLHNGLWVRRQSGYKKKLWKKSASQKKRLRELVLCTRTQCKLLDKMTTSFWKRRNWYVDDPYQKYHDRTNLRL